MIYLESDLKQFLTCLNSAAPLSEMAQILALESPDLWLAAGCVVQSVWNVLSQRPWEYGILDFDLVYFQPDLGLHHQEQLQDRLNNIWPQRKLDIKNQALVHTWYPHKFGLQIPAFKSLEAALCTWPSTATATAVRFYKGEWQIMAPFGLSDLLALRVCPNATLVSKEIYLKKSSRWQKRWPELDVLPFTEAIGPYDLNLLPVLKLKN